MTLVMRPGSLLDRRRSRPDPSQVTVRRIVLASEGRPIPSSVIQQVVKLAKPEGAEVRVVTIARIWGTSLGFPNPGLQPTRGEWDEQRLIVRKAIEALEGAGLEASGHVIGTRRAASNRRTRFRCVCPAKYPAMDSQRLITPHSASLSSGLMPK